jgi:Fe-S cluster assembly protein SufD
MREGFDVATIDRLAQQLKEPAWLTELRRHAWAQHGRLPWPHPSDDIWRRTDVSLLDPTQGFSPAQPSLLQAIPLSDEQWTGLTQPLGHERLFVRANGAWVTMEHTRLPAAPDAAPAGGVVIQDLGQAASRHPDPIRRLLGADGLSEAEQKLATLSAAFHHDDVCVQIPARHSEGSPLRLVRLFSAVPKQAIFPMTLITVGAGSSVTLIDEYVSVAASPSDEPHLVNGRIELVLEPDASVHYVRLQRWDAQAREFLLQRATLGRGATLTTANITLGAALSKAHLVTRLAGEHASTRLYGFVFGHRAQHVDQHTLQDHQAPRTSSDLHFRAALQDRSRMVYTGLIRIARTAKQTNAYQANHNLLLSQETKAETIPMLEILADDVQCKHGASIGPIDEEQTFYLTSRGVPREIAQRLIVMGFVEPIIQQVPFEPLQERLRQEIEGGLRS